MTEPLSPAGPRGRSWRWHLLFLLLILLELAAARLLHRSQADLRRTFEEGPPGARVGALHVLANRGDPRPFTDPLPGESDRLVREFAMTTNVTRLTGTEVRWSHVASVEDPGEALRGRLLLEHAVGTGGRWIRLAEVRAWFESLEGGR